MTYSKTGSLVAAAGAAVVTAILALGQHFALAGLFAFAGAFGLSFFPAALLAILSIVLMQAIFFLLTELIVGLIEDAAVALRRLRRWFARLVPDGAPLGGQPRERLAWSR